MAPTSLNEFEFNPLDIQGIFLEDSSSFLPFLLRLDAYLNDFESCDFLVRKLNFITYDLKVRCDGLKATDRIHILNDHFFNINGFTSFKEPQKNLNAYSLSHLFAEKAVNYEILTLFYQYLANQIDLAIYPTNTSPSHILKWVIDGEGQYIDIFQFGKVLSPTEVLQLLNKHKWGNDCLEIVGLKEIFEKILTSISDSLENKESYFKKLTCLNLLISLNENNLLAIGKRGLLKFKEGFLQGAYCDLKRYFAFIDFQCAPAELKVAYNHLVNIQESRDSHEMSNSLLH